MAEKDLRALHPRVETGPPVRGDRMDGTPVLGMALADGECVVLLPGDEDLAEPPHRPVPEGAVFTPSGPGPADLCAPEDLHPAEEVAAGITGAVERCLDEAGPEGAFIRALMNEVTAQGHAFWLIGGAVRDLVDIGPEARPNDLDFAGTLGPTALYEHIDVRQQAAGLGDYRLGLSPQSLVVHLARPGERQPRILEYKALAVTDFLFPAWGGDLPEDAASRDLTFNSLYYDHPRRIVADPTGLGLAHLRARPRALVSLNRERAAGRRAQVLLRFLKFGVRVPDADTAALVQWAADLPADLADALSEQEWRALEYAWLKGVPEADRPHALGLARALGPAAEAITNRLAGGRPSATARPETARAGTGPSGNREETRR